MSLYRKMEGIKMNDDNNNLNQPEKPVEPQQPSNNGLPQSQVPVQPKQPVDNGLPQPQGQTVQDFNNVPAQDNGSYVTPPNAGQGNYGLGQETANPNESNGLAIASMVLGILGLVLGCCSGLFGLPFAIMALVFAIIIMNKYKGQPLYPGKGMTIAGLILGIVGILFGIVAILFVILAVSMPSLVDYDMYY